MNTNKTLTVKTNLAPDGYRAVKGWQCSNCDYGKRNLCPPPVSCFATDRADKCQVIYEKINK